MPERGAGNWKPASSTLRRPLRQNLAVTFDVVGGIHFKKPEELFAEIPDVVETGDVGYLDDGLVGINKELRRLPQSQVADEDIDRKPGDRLYFLIEARMTHPDLFAERRNTEFRVVEVTFDDPDAFFDEFLVLTRNGKIGF